MRWFNRIIPIFQMRKLRHNERLVQGQTEKPAADLGTSPRCSDSLSLHLATAAANLLTRERLVCPTGSPSTNPKETFCDCRAKSLKMIVGQRVTISLILLTKERTSPLCFNCTRISSKHQVSPHSSQKRTVSLESNPCVILHSRVRHKELNWL